MPIWCYLSWARFKFGVTPEFGVTPKFTPDFGANSGVTPKT